MPEPPPISGEEPLAFLTRLRRRYFAPILFVVVFAHIISVALLLAYRIPLRIDTSFPEGAVVARALDVAEGRSPYQDWREWPHAFAPYGPMTYASAGSIARLVSSSPSPRAITIIGRTLSALGLLGLSLLIALFVRHLGVPLHWGFIGVGCFVAWVPMITFVGSYRPDAPQAFFSLLALAIALGGRPAGLRLILALACLWVSMWFKPTAWGMTVALAIWIVREGGARRAAICMILFAASGLFLASFLNWRSGGLLFLNMLGSLDNGWKPSNILAFYSRHPLVPAVVLLGGAGVAAAACTPRFRGSEVPLVFIALLASYAAATIQNLKVGADINYYLEPYALMSATSAWALAKLWRGEAPLVRAPVREALLLAILIPAYLAQVLPDLPYARQTLTSMRKGWEPTPLLRVLENTQGEVLTLNPFLALARPAPPTVMDHVQYQILFSRGKLTDEALVRRVEEERFRLVILPAETTPGPILESSAHAGTLSPRLLPALRAHYRETDRYGFFAILRPVGSGAGERGADPDPSKSR